MDEGRDGWADDRHDEMAFFCCQQKEPARHAATFLGGATRWELVTAQLPADGADSANELRRLHFGPAPGGACLRRSSSISDAICKSDINVCTIERHLVSRPRTPWARQVHLVMRPMTGRRKG